MARAADLLVAALGGAAEGLNERQTEKRKAQTDLQSVLAKALVEQRVKQRFDPEQRALQMIQEMVPIPSRSTTPVPLRPEFAQEDAKRKQLEMMQRYGLLKRPSTDLPAIIFNPNTSQYTDASGNPVTTVPRGSPVRNAPLSEATLTNRAAASATGAARGQAESIGLKPLVQEAATTVTSAESAMEAIDELLDVEQQKPGSIKKAIALGATPFNIGLIAGSQETQTANLLLKRLQTEITTARGGKQLTQTEIRFINQLLPNIFRGGEVNMKGLQDLRRYLEQVKTRIVQSRGAAEGEAIPSNHLGRFTIEAE